MQMVLIFSQAAQNNQEQIKQQAENKINKLHKEMRILDMSSLRDRKFRKICSNCGAAKPQKTFSLSYKMRCSECNEIVDLSNGIPNQTVVNRLKESPLINLFRKVCS